ncbi:hypothetical protein ABIB80_007516 [Bradyrhizobium sp. i1.15.2]
MSKTDMSLDPDPGAIRAPVCQRFDHLNDGLTGDGFTIEIYDTGNSAHFNRSLSL